jgi:hypothetical protein
MLAGFDDGAECELSCVKLRVDGAFRIVASGAVLEASGLEFRRKLEAVEATNRLRDAIVEVEANDGRQTRGALGSSTAIGDTCTKAPI